MGFGKYTLAAFGAISLAATPVMAQTAPTQTAEAVRADEARDSESQMEGGGGWLLLPPALIAIILAIIIAAQQNDDTPTSP